MSLFLDSLQLENYRVFRQLRIERLGRVNLFVGKNNAGKSSILEAVRLYASGGSVDMLLTILDSHDEMRAGTMQPEDRLYGLRYLFHGRRSEWTKDVQIRIGPIHAREPLTIAIHEPVHFVVISDDSHTQRFNAMDSDWRTGRLPFKLRESIPQTYVPPQGIAAEEAAGLWDLITLTDLEQSVIEALRIISPEIERISFIGERGQNRIPMAKLTNMARPIPLRSLGDGVGRMLGIALALVSARGGVFLVDEVENGIHFAAQEQLWQLIFRLAHDLNTQVFATSHSWDCIEAFQRAAAPDPYEEAALVRLDAHREVVTATTISERDLAIVTRDKIEVR